MEKGDLQPESHSRPNRSDHAQPYNMSNGSVMAEVEEGEVAVDPKAILGARLLAMLLQEVVLDVAVRAHGLISAERREAALASSSSSTSPTSSSPITTSRIQDPSSSSSISMVKPSPPRRTGDGDAMVVDEEAFGSVGGEGGEREDGEVVEDEEEESVCAKCGKADCVGASGAVDCPDPSGSQTATNSQSPSQANGSTSTPSASQPGPSATATGPTTIKPDLYSHNPLYECLVCSRQVAANRYATHLANCLGIGAKAASSRKVANRGQKIANILENRRKATALVQQEGGGGGRAGTPGMGGMGLLGRAGGAGGDSRQSTPVVGGYGGGGGGGDVSREASTFHTAGDKK
ncbi:hypothetical protein A4X13_0g2656 [Tilletia indica]|uniref:SAGA-associated factor 11 n=1 Tax=Tilletia indica TaxID=43049 RepID=A0A8T8T4Z3_9BASI|nr:hypothetical protein A4X13_0g2656 [Tilletia indica]